MGSSDSKPKDEKKKGKGNQPQQQQQQSSSGTQESPTSPNKSRGAFDNNNSNSNSGLVRQQSSTSQTFANSNASMAPSASGSQPQLLPPQQGSYQDFQALKTTVAHQMPQDVVAQIAFNWTQPPIDAGGFSSIYAGKYYNTEVVVKLLAIRDQSEHDMFKEELAVLINPDFVHPNLVPLIGYCLERPSLVFQRLKPMKQDRMQRLPLDVREMIAIDATRGIAHMHSKGYVHRDLKPDNVLLEFDPNRHFVRALISDMGCARTITIPIAPFGTMLFMDNHLLAMMAQNQAVITEPMCCNDVYSLGLTIACILTARPAHQKQDFDMMINEIETHDMQRGQLLRSMIQDNQAARPTAAQVLAQLEALQGKPHQPRQGAHQPLFAATPMPAPTAHHHHHQQMHQAPPTGYQQPPPQQQHQYHHHHHHQQQQQGVVPAQQPLHRQNSGVPVQAVPVHQHQGQHPSVRRI